MKIGRNDICPCGSGKKYKRCCVGKEKGAAVSPSRAKERVTLGGAIQHIQEQARQKKEAVHQVGVFLLYADRLGDAWLLEITDSDCAQIAAAGEPMDIGLQESEETIVVDWSHTFSFKNKRMEICSYGDKTTSILENAPAQQLFAGRRKILKRVSPELLEQVHVDG